MPDFTPHSKKLLFTIIFTNLDILDYIQKSEVKIALFCEFFAHCVYLQRLQLIRKVKYLLLGILA